MIAGGGNGFYYIRKRSGLSPAADAGRLPERVVFAGEDAFAKTVRTRVAEHFAGAERRDDPRLYRKAAIIALWFTSVLRPDADGTDLGPRSFVLCVSYALAAGAWGFNIFHDSNHGSFSGSQRVNVVLSRTSCAVLGTGRYFWRYKHNVLHHRFTNIFRWDDDIETRGKSAFKPAPAVGAQILKNQHRWFGFTLLPRDARVGVREGLRLTFTLCA